MKPSSQTLKSLEKQFLEVYKIPKYHLEYTCGAENDDEDCPSDDIECKDCPYKALESVETQILDEHWIEFIAVCGNNKMLHFPYENTYDMKRHVLQIVTNSYKFPPIVKVVQKFFPTER